MIPYLSGIYYFRQDVCFSFAAMSRSYMRAIKLCCGVEDLVLLFASFALKNAFKKTSFYNLSTQADCDNSFLRERI